MSVNEQEIENQLAVFRQNVKEQGDFVRDMKARGVAASDLDLKQAIAELKARKKTLEEREAALRQPDGGAEFDRASLENLLLQRFFYDQAFSIYGGVQGLYDFGPHGCAVKANLIAQWRAHFIHAEQMLEVDCCQLTPEQVLKASGHVERFSDVMVRDVKTDECFRADHLIEAALQKLLRNESSTNTAATTNNKAGGKTAAAPSPQPVLDEAARKKAQQTLTQLDNLSLDGIAEVIREFQLRAPLTNNELSPPEPFNLMFSTKIGPSGKQTGFFRPETAQGIFVNFQRLCQANEGRLPFAVAQIGKAFRNEISPRAGLLRVREFEMAEIEHFVDPRDKSFEKFRDEPDLAAQLCVPLLSACRQMAGQSAQLVTLQEAVDTNLLTNETLAYYMGRIYALLMRIGLKADRVRFRQHMSNEMAHYAQDCWDAEVLTSYGWIECVGCADRSCYDLVKHSEASGVRLVATKQLSQPKKVVRKVCTPNMKLLGAKFRKDAKRIADWMESMSESELEREMANQDALQISIDEQNFSVERSMFKIETKEENISVEEIQPNVIEPSFGIGRLLYCMFEHNFCVRDGDEQRTFLSLPAQIAPYACSVLPLSNRPEFVEYVRRVSSLFKRAAITYKVDASSAAIGRRYARTDQIGIPFGVTVDFDTTNIEPVSVTLRERDSMEQIRVQLEDELVPLLLDLLQGRKTWKEVTQQYELFETQQTS